MEMITYSIAVFVFSTVDVYVYTTVSLEHRTSHWGYKLIGGGFVARLKYGKK